MASRICLALGGIRSGKSAFAERLAGETADSVLYVATGVATDPEMQERIRRHREARPAHWTTLEAPLDLAPALAARLVGGAPPDAALIDSVDVWLANLLLAHEQESKPRLEDKALRCVDALVTVMEESPVAFFLVSSEVGHSLVATEALGRRFQDALGLVNQELATAADEVYFVTAGIPVKIKPQENSTFGL